LLLTQVAPQKFHEQFVDYFLR